MINDDNVAIAPGLISYFANSSAEKGHGGCYVKVAADVYAIVESRTMASRRTEVAMSSSGTIIAHVPDLIHGIASEPWLACQRVNPTISLGWGCRCWMWLRYGILRNYLLSLSHFEDSAPIGSLTYVISFTLPLLSTAIAIPR